MFNMLVIFSPGQRATTVRYCLWLVIICTCKGRVVDPCMTPLRWNLEAEEMPVASKVKNNKICPCLRQNTIKKTMQLPALDN